jgi:hypothetical protein
MLCTVQPLPDYLSTHHTLQNKGCKHLTEVNYLGIKLTSDVNTEREVSEQFMKANRITGGLDDCVWRNQSTNL